MLNTFGSALYRPETFPPRFVEPFEAGSGLHFARHIRRLRDSLGRTSDAVELVAVLDNSGAIEHLLLLKDGVKPEVLSPFGEVVYIHPFGGMWIYSDGKEQCHVLRLRDGTGWAVRNVTKELKAFRSLYGGVFKTEKVASSLLRSSWFCSEQGRGASLIFVGCQHTDYQLLRDREGGPLTSGMRLSQLVPFDHPRELLRLATLDGAILLSGGRGDRAIIYDACVYFHSPGGRHKSAEYIVTSPETTWAIGAIIISEDGAVSWYKRGYEGIVGGDVVRWI